MLVINCCVAPTIGNAGTIIAVGADAALLARAKASITAWWDA